MIVPHPRDVRESGAAGWPGLALVLVNVGHSCEAYDQKAERSSKGSQQGNPGIDGVADGLGSVENDVQFPLPG